jgi:hypothetical protein
VNGVKNPDDVLAVPIDPGDMQVRRGTGNQGRHAGVTVAERPDRVGDRLLALGLRDQRQQRVGRRGMPTATDPVHVSFR